MHFIKKVAKTHGLMLSLLFVPVELLAKEEVFVCGKWTRILKDKLPVLDALTDIYPDEKGKMFIARQKDKVYTIMDSYGETRTLEPLGPFNDKIQIYRAPYENYAEYSFYGVMKKEGGLEIQRFAWNPIHNYQTLCDKQ